MNRSLSSKGAQERGALLCALRGLCASVLALTALAAVCSAAALSMDDPGAYVKIFGFISLFGGAFAGGFCAAHAKGSATLLCGLLTGAFLLALIALAALCLSLPMSVPVFAASALSVLLCSVLGANAGVGAHGGKSKKKKHGKNRA